MLRRIYKGRIKKFYQTTTGYDYSYIIDQAGLIGKGKLTVLEAEKKPEIDWKPKTIEAEIEKPLILRIPFKSLLLTITF